MKCPVCYSESHSFLFTAYDILYQMTERGFRVCKCRQCAAVYIAPFPSQKDTEQFYPKNYYSYDVAEGEGFFERLKRKIVKSKVGNIADLSLLDRVLVMVFQSRFSGIPLYRKEKGRFLDIGCGSGKNLKLVSEYGWDAYGIELDAAAVEYAQKQGLKVQQSSLESMQFQEIQFDCIRIWHVFEHLTNPHEALKKITGVLAPGGEILVAVPNAQSFARIMFGRYWYGLDAPRHVINYSPKTLRLLLKKYDLKITEITYASCGSFVASVSNFLKRECGFQGNLINNVFLVFLFSPLDYLSDFFGMGDTIFLKIQKK